MSEDVQDTEEYTAALSESLPNTPESVAKHIFYRDEENNSVPFSRSSISFFTTQKVKMTAVPLQINNCGVSVRFTCIFLQHFCILSKSCTLQFNLSLDLLLFHNAFIS